MVQNSERLTSFEAFSGYFFVGSIWHIYEKVHWMHLMSHVIEVNVASNSK